MRLTPAILFSCSLLLSCSGVSAQDDVTIPKSRLEELEQKERELEKLKGKPATPASKQVVAPETRSKPAPLPVPTRKVPAVAALPPVEEGAQIDSEVLAAYYQAEKAAADERFRGKKLVVRGEIVGFTGALFRRNYRVILQGADKGTRVICDLMPPEQYKSVFTVKDGAELVGLVGETRVPIARLGNTAVVEGKCKGWKDNSVRILGTRLDLKQ